MTRQRLPGVGEPPFAIRIYIDETTGGMVMEEITREEFYEQAPPAAGEADDEPIRMKVSEKEFPWGSLLALTIGCLVVLGVFFRVAYKIYAGQ